MSIDEERDYTPHNYNCTSKEDVVLTDHNTIIINANWLDEISNMSKSTSKSYDNIKEEVEAKKISEICEQDKDFQLIYDE